MRDSPGKKKRKKTARQNTGAAHNGPGVSYTPQQQRMIQNGLRIWARVAIRSYLRQRAGESQDETGPVAEAES